MPDTLYGYMMGVFAKVDLLSAHWRGTFDGQGKRMVSFMDTYMQPDHIANSVAIQVWRHKLMHTSSPRTLHDPNTNAKYPWLLHWGDEHLPRDQHFKFQSGTTLQLSLMGLIDNLRSAATTYLKDLHSNSGLQSRYDAVAHELETYPFRNI